MYFSVLSYFTVIKHEIYKRSINMKMQWNRTQEGARGNGKERKGKEKSKLLTDTCTS